MSEQDFREIARNGLWRNNPGLVQLLGLCPLLGTSNSTVNALGLGLATMLVLACSNAAVSLVRGAVSEAIRLPAFVMIIAVLTTCIELLMQAWTYELYQVLGIFIPLITTNCVILGRAEAFAAKNGVLRASFDGLLMGLGFALVLLVLGGLRELLGQGYPAGRHALAVRPGGGGLEDPAVPAVPGLPAGDPAAGRVHHARPADRPEEPYR